MKSARPLDKRNFRKKILAMGLLVETDEIEQDVSDLTLRFEGGRIAASEHDGGSKSQQFCFK